ncbi:MAG: AAA family ATPase, partial [Lachnospiraceae bacterium]|nr:AAA family ATPase [Lachnospiraceae bacterium]
MNIKRAKNEIKNTIEAYLLKDEFGEYVIPQIRQRPVLLLGAPGIGKTQIMEQIARECQIGLVAYTITHHTRQSAIGLPFIAKQDFDGREYAVTEYTMSEIVASIYIKMETTGLREGILFIDEINCVSETLAPAMLQFLQCKTFGSHEIPKGWIIVAAGNPPEYNKSVREFDVVTMDRVKKIEVEPDYTVWKEYAQKEQIHSAVISYLDTRPGNFYKMETTVDGRKFATPRGWEDLSTMLKVYEALGKEADREVVVQYIQHEMIAKDFANYLELYHKYQMDYQLDAVLAGHIDEVLLKQASHAPFDERLSVVSLLLSRCRESFAAQKRREVANLLLYEQIKLVKSCLFGTSCPTELA